MSIIVESLKRSPFWWFIKEMHLATKMTLDLDQREFSEWLLKLGEGRLEHVRMPGTPYAPNDLIGIPK